MYKLHYVKGISSYDTLQFNSLSDQEDFFDECVVGQPIDEYYPPLYKNRIKFAFDDYSISSLVANYLSLEYKNKTYYYFIDRINYISEDLYEFEITMDTIQTYMFNVKKVGKVSRKSIDRYSNNEINRNYVRVNYSQEDYDLIDSYNVTPNFIYVLAVFSEYHGPNSTGMYTVDFKKLGTDINPVINNGLYYFILPIATSLDYYRTKVQVGTSVTDCRPQDIRDAIKHITADPYCVMCSIMKSPLISRLISFTVQSDRVVFSDNTDGIEFNLSTPFFEYDDGTQTTRTTPFIAINKITSNFINFFASFAPSFNTNTALGVNFDYHFVPYVLDENYIKIEFGEKMQLTTYPLHKVTKGYTVGAYAKCYARLDFESLYRNYKILGVDDTFDKYITLITVSTQPTMVLNTDSWEQYYASNKANYSIGINKDLANIIWSNVSGTAQTAGRTEITGQTLRNNGLTQIFNGIDTHNPQMMDSGANTMTTGHMYTSFGKTQIKAGIANTAIQFANYGEELKIIKQNVSSTPNTVSFGNQAINDWFNDTFDILYLISMVRDIENVARKVEYYGYDVNEYYVQSLYNGFVDFNTRYYYNILQMDGLTLIENMIIPNDLKADLIGRLKAGIRLWNLHSVNEEIGNALQYDNVENKYISQ